MNYKTYSMVLNYFTLASKSVIKLFKFIQVFILVALPLIFNMAQAASKWTWVTDTPVLGDGNHSVYIDGRGLINDLEDDGWYWAHVNSTLKEYYKAIGSSQRIVLNTFNYSGTPSTRSITGREPGEYYYKLTVCTEDETGEEYCPSYTTNTVTVSAQVPDTPSLTNISSSNAHVEYYVSWSSVSQADTYQVAEKTNNGSWVYGKYTVPADDNDEVEFIGQTDGTYSYQVRACNSSGCSSYSSIKTIVVTAPVPETVSLPYSESFESNLGEWKNAGSKSWSRDAYGTSSGGTGPSNAKDGNYYMYMETSSGSAYYSGDTASLVSPYFNASGISVSFSYHMYGSNMGTLYFEIYSNGQWNNIWSKSGQQHTSNAASWASASVSLAAYSGILQIRFRGVAAGGYRGDMAIDNIQISNTNQERRKVTFIHTDLLGSPAAETDNTGVIQGGG